MADLSLQNHIVNHYPDHQSTEILLRLTVNLHRCIQKSGISRLCCHQWITNHQQSVNRLLSPSPSDNIKPLPAPMPNSRKLNLKEHSFFAHFPTKSSSRPYNTFHMQSLFFPSILHFKIFHRTSAIQKKK